MKVLLAEVSLMKFYSSDIQGDQMEDKIGVIRSIIDERHSSDIKRYPVKGQSGFTRNIIGELHSSNNQRDQMEG